MAIAVKGLLDTSASASAKGQPDASAPASASMGQTSPTSSDDLPSSSSILLSQLPSSQLAPPHKYLSAPELHDEAIQVDPPRAPEPHQHIQCRSSGLLRGFESPGLLQVPRGSSTLHGQLPHGPPPDQPAPSSQASRPPAPSSTTSRPHLLNHHGHPPEPCSCSGQPPSHPPEIFEVENLSPPSSLEVKGGFVEPSRSEPYYFEPLAKGADSQMPKAGAAEAVEDRMGPISE
ncbi:hypothetical protein CRENBAI_001534 [Crenichthys baileyi]|uniref:Uncharacterized protein n=1 Tax=Crenichthys baileyi TaxID=28760 RepID=A0AAV9S8L6_9TELE